MYFVAYGGLFLFLSLSWQANETAVMFHRIVSVQWAKVSDGSESKYTVYSSLVSFIQLLHCATSGCASFVVCSVFLSVACPHPLLFFITVI